MTTRTLQAPYGARSSGRDASGSVVQRVAAALRAELKGWIAAARTPAVPADAKLTLRAQRLMRSF